MNENNNTLRVLVVGATGGSGRAAVQHLLAQGCRVTAFSRSASRLADLSGDLRVIDGDASNPADVDRAVQGQDAVVVTLGITENPIRVRLLGTARTPIDIRSKGTSNVIDAMKRHGVRKLVVQTTYGIGETEGRLGIGDQLFFSVLLKPQIDDTKVQEQFVRNSGLDWTLAQPVHLTDDDAPSQPFISLQGETGVMKVSRRAVGGFLSAAVLSERYVGKSVALSGVAA